MTTHYFQPVRVKNAAATESTSPCCDKPEAAHPPFVAGERVALVLARDVRGLKGGVLRKGSVVEATKDTYPALAIVARDKWGRPTDYSSVAVPSWTVVVDTWATALPLRYGKET